MNIKHKNLELIRNNPAFINAIKTSETQSGGKSMLRCWQYAVSNFHRNDSQTAINYLEERLNNNFKTTMSNKDRAIDFINKLEKYITNYNQLNFKVYKTLSKLKYDVGNGNLLTGEIFRIDKKDENFYISLFYKGDGLWANELRFPLIQIHFSNLLKWPIDQIHVGVFNYNKMEHEHISFDESTLANSLEEVKNIFKLVTNK